MFLALLVCAVLAAAFLALFRTLPRGPRALQALAGVLTALACLVGAIGAATSGYFT